jgi:hypothetical protein
VSNLDVAGVDQTAILSTLVAGTPVMIMDMSTPGNFFYGAISTITNGTTYFAIQMDSSVIGSLTNTGGIALFMFFPVPDAMAVPYEPGDPTQWSGTPPATVKQALDRQAVAIAAGLTGPIA